MKNIVSIKLDQRRQLLVIMLLSTRWQRRPLLLETHFISAPFSRLSSIHFRSVWVTSQLVTFQNCLQFNGGQDWMFSNWLWMCSDEINAAMRGEGGAVRRRHGKQADDEIRSARDKMFQEMMWKPRGRGGPSDPIWQLEWEQRRPQVGGAEGVNLMAHYCPKWMEEAAWPRGRDCKRRRTWRCWCRRWCCSPPGWGTSERLCPLRPVENMTLN